MKTRGFEKKTYQTRAGHVATVARLKCMGGMQWIYTGTIEVGGVMYSHHWNVAGNSLTNANGDLIGFLPAVEAGESQAPVAQIIPFPIVPKQPEHFAVSNPFMVSM